MDKQYIYVLCKGIKNVSYVPFIAYLDKKTAEASLKTHYMVADLNYEFFLMEVELEYSEERHEHKDNNLADILYNKSIGNYQDIAYKKLRDEMYMAVIFLIKDYKIDFTSNHTYFNLSMHQLNMYIEFSERVCCLYWFNINKTNEVESKIFHYDTDQQALLQAIHLRYMDYLERNK